MLGLNLDSNVMEFDLPVSYIYPCSKAAKDLGIDFSVSKEDFVFKGKRWRKAQIIGNTTSLFGIGLQTGLNLFRSKTISPISKEMDRMQAQIDNLKNKKP